MIFVNVLVKGEEGEKKKTTRKGFIKSDLLQKFHGQTSECEYSQEHIENHKIQDAYKPKFQIYKKDNDKKYKCNNIMFYYKCHNDKINKS
jgi:hypothetical protein